MDRSATTDLYDALAPIYDAWQSSNGMTPFGVVTAGRLRPLLERHAAGGPLAFLDAGCGTGTLLHTLRAAHPTWRLAGVDVSRGMLAVAARKPGAGRIAWARAPVDAPLPFAPRFDVAAAFYDTLNHLPDEAALARAFAALAGTLRPGGRVVFDVTNRLGFERWWRGCNDFRAARWRLTVDARFDPVRGVGRARVSIDHDTGRGELRLVERLIPDAEVERALAAAGLKKESADPWSPFDLDAPGKTWWVARRTANR